MTIIDKNETKLLIFIVCMFYKVLASAWWTIKDDTFGWLNPHLFIILWMCERQLDRLLDDTKQAKSIN